MTPYGGLLTREELYDLVWAEPMSAIAPTFGLSDVGLAKVCRAAQIPVPPRGYWAKLRAGKPTSRIALPPRAPGMSDFVRAFRKATPDPAGPTLSDEAEGLAASPTTEEPPEFPDDIPEIEEGLVRKVGRVGFPRLGERAHPIVARLLEADAARAQKELAGGWPSWSNVPRFSDPATRPRLRVVNALLLALERSGASTAVRDEEATEFTARVGDTPVLFTVRSRHRRPTRDGKALPARIEIEVQGASRQLIKAWDEKKSPLETQLAEIVVGILITGELNYREGQISLHRELLRLQEEMAAAERKRMAAAELESREQLVRDARAWMSAREVRTFVAAVQASGREAAAIHVWSEWALAQSDLLDPLLNGSFMPATASEVEI